MPLARYGSAPVHRLDTDTTGDPGVSAPSREDHKFANELERPFVPHDILPFPVTRIRKRCREHTPNCTWDVGAGELLFLQPQGM